MNKPGITRIEKPACFGNWFDVYGYPLTSKLLPFVAKFNWITPNIVTLFSFFLYVIGCLLLFIKAPYHQYLAAILLIVAYIGDQLDGQLARFKKLSSPLGNYLDKVVDVLKIYIITISLSYAAYLNTSEIVYIFLGFTTCFFFNYRYYIKLESVISQSESDMHYLNKCSQRYNYLIDEVEREYKTLSKGFLKRVKLFWLKNRTIFWVDEAEFVVFTSIAAIFNQIELVLWIFAISQTLIAFWRLFERGYQTHKTPEKLLDPMRK